MVHRSSLDGVDTPTGKVPLMFGITQGGTDPELRRECTRNLTDLDMDGYGIGGLSIGESKQDTFASLAACTRLLPVAKPRYFMGVGEPEDVLRSVNAGVDVFDSVFPTRNARHKSLFTPQGRENVRGPRWRGASGPAYEGCSCSTCKRFDRGYLYHLFKAQEPLAAALATTHNLTFMQDLINGIRVLLREGSFSNATKIADCIQAVR